MCVYKIISLSCTNIIAVHLHIAHVMLKFIIYFLDAEQIHDKALSKHDIKPAAANNNLALRRYPSVQTSGITCPSRILDLSTLKRQPKLL